ILMTGAEMEEIGIKVFDVVSVTGEFAETYPALLRDFLQVTEEQNANYAADPAAMQEVIAEAAGMELEDSNSVLSTFSFPDRDAQLSDAWMGGTVQDFVKNVSDFFVAQGELEAALDSYDEFVDTTYLKAVK
ncbi:MAG: taurine ABC transporter substrate-binding protein, partial [Chloroflexota bacterium]